MPNPGPMNILLVDDDAIEAESVTRAFQKANIRHSIIEAHDGIEALSLLRSGAVPRPLIILLDLNMPKMSGIEFLGEIRSDPQLKDQIVFVLTTSRAEQDSIAAYGFNVAGYVTMDKAGWKYRELVRMLHCYWNIVELPVGGENAEYTTNIDSR